MNGRSQVRLKDKTDTHGISSTLSHVDRCAERVLQFQLSGLDGNNLHHGKFRDKRFGILRFQALVIVKVELEI